jgi:asparagine synthase (glutamine-hydrolysing)
VAFAHLRLSIIDLGERNAQPMVDADERFVLAYNGEIYNYVELRTELEALGHRFVTTGDTEVLLAAWRQWGAGSLGRLVGMWAFALFDAQGQTVSLARDRFGIKPLFWARHDDTVWFGSELKAFRAVPGLALAPDDRTVHRYLLTGTVDDDERTFFENVQRVNPATLLTFGLDGRGPEAECYWAPPDVSFSGSFADASARYAELFVDAVRIHARADVQIGTCLSGGLDSSAVAYVASDPQMSERRWIDAVTETTGIATHLVKTDPATLATRVPAIVASQDEPFGSASIAVQALVFERAASEGLKVMLDGQGADEVLGGYLTYLPARATDLLRSGRFAAWLGLERDHRKTLGRPVLGATGVGSLARHAIGGRIRGTKRPAASFRELLLTQTTAYGLPALLRFEDRASMASSVESRVPFLDHRLVDFAFSLPDDYKVIDAVTKRVLREAIGPMMPSEIAARRDKIGFRADPALTWQLVEQHRDDLVSPRDEREKAWFDAGETARLLSGKDRSTTAEFAAWRLICTKLWLRTWWGGQEVLR